MQPTSLRELIVLKKDLERISEQETKLYNAKMQELNCRVEGINSLISNIQRNLDPNKLKIASQILQVSGDCNSPTRHDTVIAVVNDIVSNNCASIRKQYFGTKSGTSHSDEPFKLPYGVEPTYGVVIFSIGFSPQARKVGLFSHEIESCIYALLKVADGFLTSEQLYNYLPKSKTNSSKRFNNY